MSTEKKKPTRSAVNKKTAAKSADPKKTAAKPADKKSASKSPAAKKKVARKAPAAKAPQVKKEGLREQTFPGSSRPKSAEMKTGPSPEAPPAESLPVPLEAESLSPLERKLADPVLPELPRENRARLQMQSPSRLYFYWSIKNNPFQTLSRAFGDVGGSYSLVVKLVNHTRGDEQMFRVEPEGNWWFNVDPDCVYRAEIGFYATSRPYIRIVNSNYVKTPRRSPSWRTDYVPRFTVSAGEFAEVLDASGYSRDAFEVALAGDDRAAADDVTRKTVNGLLGNLESGLDAFDGDELRFVLLALASGYTLAELEGQISSALYEKLMGSGVRVSSEQALAALKENFDVETDELTEFEETGPAVFGLSAVHFPKRIVRRKVPRKLLNKLSKFDTVSSSR